MARSLKSTVIFMRSGQDGYQSKGLTVISNLKLESSLSHSGQGLNYAQCT